MPRGPGMGGSGGGWGGRMAGPAAAGLGGACICPSSGHHQSHQRGVPCSALKCLKCSATMTRE
ncbi:MAG: hypothetical protein EHM79_15275 [Geobacter sp.]|nr:MAG: hypothetical protein EHM79_15275 [Geobacter sp.]